MAEKSNSMNTIFIFLDYLLLYLNTSVFVPNLFSIFIIKNFWLLISACDPFNADLSSNKNNNRIIDDPLYN